MYNGMDGWETFNIMKGKATIKSVGASAKYICRECDRKAHLFLAI